MKADAPAIVETAEEAAALDVPPLLVLQPLELLLDELQLGHGPLAAEPIGDGHSNINYLISRNGSELILRRPPRPPLAPSSHDVVREARIVRALQDSGAPVPRVIFATSDLDVIGAPFYIMERVEGDVIGELLPERFSAPEHLRRIGEEVVDALSAIHAVDWQACGLGDLARHSGYLERQLRRFADLWRQNRTRDLPIMDQVAQWLADRMPRSQETTLVHGDYRIGNTMFDPYLPPRLAAVLDWEMATLGDPLADVGYLLANWPEADEPTDVMLALSEVTRVPGFPSRDELMMRYQAVSGRSVARIHWYMVLAIWKSAVFLEGSYGRFLSGRTDDQFFASLRVGVPALAERAWGMVAVKDVS